MTWGVPLLVSYHFAFSYCSWGSQGKNTEVACHSLLQWTLSDLSTMTHLSWVPPQAWLGFIELDKAVVLVWLDWLVFCEYAFSVSALWYPLATPTILLGFLLPWAWGISSRLLQQSTAAAPYFGWGISPPTTLLDLQHGDWNAKVGSQETPGVTCKFGLGVRNEAGQRLIEFCQENALVIANTLFQQHKKRLYTWTSPDGQHQNQIDYILCSQRWRSSIQSAKIRPGADYGSDHELLIAKFRLKLKKVGKTPRPFRYDLNQIPYDYTVEVRNRFK